MSQQIQITGGAKVRNLEGVLTGSSGVVSSLGINVPDGIPQLDGSGKILVSQLPNSVMEYKGTWDASTNTPTLADGTGNAGDVYVCSVAGTVNFGSGPIVFYVGDQVLYSGTIWQRASGSSGTVTSVSVTESGDALTITGSPITTSGTINIGFSGNSGQYINGAGGLTTFPTDNITGSGSSGQVTYFDGTNTITGESSFVYDASTNRLGVNTSVPNATIGANAGTDSGYSLLLKNDNANYNGIGFATSSVYGNVIGTEKLGTAPAMNMTLLNQSGYISITETGNLGVNIINPNAGVDIYSSTSSSLWLHTANSGVSGTDGVRFSLFSNSNAVLRNNEGSLSMSSEGDFYVITLGAENIRVNSTDGKVGIGNPTTVSEMLTVNGSIQQAGVLSSMLKTNADGKIIAAVAGTDYVAPSSLSGYVPTSRTLTINGTPYDLSADRSWSVGTITGSGADGRVPFFDSASGITYDSGFIYESGANRLGVNTVSPNATIGANAPTDGIYSLLLKNSDTNYSGIGFGTSSVYGNTIETVRIGTAPSRNLTLYNYAGYVSITESGNLGVNILTPNNGIDIYNSTQSQLWLHNNATGVSSTDGVRLALFNNKSANLVNFDGPLSLTAEGDFSVITLGAENIRVNSANGYVSIGNPSTVLALLHVYRAESAADLLVQTNSITDYAEIAGRNYNSVSTTYYRQYSSGATGTDFGLSRSNLAALFSNYASNFAVGTQNGGDLILGTANTERMRILASGNIGIGTASNISASLTIYSATEANQFKLAGAAPAVVYADSLSTPSYVAVAGLTTAVNNFVNGSVVGDFVIANQKNYSILFATGSSTSIKMKLTSAGDLGIGTTSPDTKLDVRGEISLSYSANNGLRFYNQDRSNWSSISNTIATPSSEANLVFRTAAGVALTIDGTRAATFTTNVTAQQFISALNTSNSQINTGSAEIQSYAVNNSWISDNLYFNGSAFKARNNGYIQQIYFNTDGSMDFNTNPTIYTAEQSVTLPTRMRITSSGNVGIGTSSPSRLLNISGSGTDGTQVQINGTVDSAGIKFIPVTGDNWEIQANTSNQFFVYNRTDNAYRFLIDGSGNVGINASNPLWKFEVRDNSSSNIGVAGFTNTSSANTSAKQVSILLNLADTVGDIKSTGSITAYPDNANVISGGLIFATRSGDGGPYERMRITSNGTIGIAGSADINNAGLDKLSIGHLSGSYGWIQSWNATSLLLNPLGNNVLIGTTTDNGAKLQVNGNVSAPQFYANYVGAGFRGIEYQSSGTIFGYSKADPGSGEYRHYIGPSAGWAGYMTFYTDNAEKMRITSAAQAEVGIGTSSLGYASSGRGNVNIEGTASSILALRVNAANDAYFYTDGANTYLSRTASGNLYVTAYTGGVYLANGATSWTANSDERLKNITGNIDNALSSLMTLRTVKHTWKSDDSNKEYLALIAQDVEKVFPQVIDKNKLPSTPNNPQTDETEYLGVRYQELVPVLIAAIQELKLEIDQLKNK